MLGLEYEKISIVQYHSDFPVLLPIFIRKSKGFKIVEKFRNKAEHVRGIYVTEYTTVLFYDVHEYIVHTIYFRLNMHGYHCIVVT